MVNISSRITFIGIERHVILDSGRIHDFSGEQRERIHADILPPHAAVLALAQHFCNRSVGKAFLRSQGAPEFPFRRIDINAVDNLRDILQQRRIGNQLAHPGRTHHIADRFCIIAIRHNDLAGKACIPNDSRNIIPVATDCPLIVAVFNAQVRAPVNMPHNSGHRESTVGSFQGGCAVDIPNFGIIVCPDRQGLILDTRDNTPGAPRIRCKIRIDNTHVLYDRGRSLFASNDTEESDVFLFTMVFRVVIIQARNRMHLPVECSLETVNRVPRNTPRHSRLVEVTFVVQHVPVHHDILREDGASLSIAPVTVRPVHDSGKAVEFFRIRNDIAIVLVHFRSFRLEPLGIENLIALICCGNGIDGIPAEVFFRIPAGKDIAFARDGPREFRPDSMDIRIYAQRIHLAAIGFKRHAVHAFVMAPVFHVGSLRRRDMRHGLAFKVCFGMPGQQFVVFAFNIGYPELVTGKDFLCPGVTTARIETERNRRQRFSTNDNSAEIWQRIRTNILTPYQAVNTAVAIIPQQDDDGTIGKLFLRHGGSDRIDSRSKGKHVVYDTTFDNVFADTSRHRTHATRFA